ncbi:hypothetical protein DVH24_024224 [Malus domestica]|uniref:Uncharacterized protein n=1 Tax=Malus domestica TaxID=3750 RepID=A0A498JG85_MALDO|nr:hypothetical protein DVH24_024224 [Malus domestica]
MGEIRTGSLPDFEDGKGLGDVGDDALHGIRDFEVGGLGHLVEDGLLVGWMGVNTDFAEVGTSAL